MAVLVTGCAGYIGSIASQVLIEEGYEVIGIDNLENGFQENIPSEVDFYQSCISDEARLSKIFSSKSIEAILHFAAYIEVSESVKDPEKYIENNLHKSKTFLDIALKHNIPSFIYSSTAAVYGIPDNGTNIKDSQVDDKDANEKLKPINPYGESKLSFEKVLKQSSLSNNFNYIALRYFNVAGAYESYGECHDPETHLIPLVLDTALGKRESISIFGTDYETPDGTAVRDYIHVKDLVDAHILALRELNNLQHTSKNNAEHARANGDEALTNNKVNRAYNLGYGHGFSVREVIDTVKKVTEKDFTVIEDQVREGDPPILVADSSEAKEILGWQPKLDNLEIIVNAAYEHRKLLQNKQTA